MGYAKEVLARSGTRHGGRIREKRFVDSVPCAYCRGRGVDPKYGTRCTVCHAAGEVQVIPPVVTCLSCCASGRDGAGLSCLACRGVGVVSVGKDAVTCPKCRGSGQDGVFYCLACKGQGVA